jgi:hypothetical protein
MATKRPLYIPTIVKDENYEPSTSRPRIFFWNGLLESEGYYIEGYEEGTTNIQSVGFQQIPYVDHYSASFGEVPSSGSKSLLFFNEQNPYGIEPQQNLYSNYWNQYVQFLYNPRTRLVRVSAKIPLAEYFDTELNDLITFRGNQYQLRAINNYNIQDGSCLVELIGPVDQNVFDLSAQSKVPDTSTTTTTTTVAPTTTTTTTSSPTTTTTTTSSPTTTTTTTAAPTTTTTTTAPTTTTTTTAAPGSFATWYVNDTEGGGYLTDSAACSGGNTFQVVYTDPQYTDFSTLDPFSTRFYSDQALTTEFDGAGNYYGISTQNNAAIIEWVTIVGSGFMFSKGFCL